MNPSSPKVVVANRGEIAVRVLRAASELGLETVAVYAFADRGSAHRLKADEAWPLGTREQPVGAYLDVEGLLRIASESAADLLHPGYGFLSESPVLAATCERAGVTFVGPPPRVLELTGDKVEARRAASSANVPVLAASGPVASEADAVAAAEQLGYPVFVKAAGGGGHGLRLARSTDHLIEAVATAGREAEASFGNARFF